MSSRASALSRASPYQRHGPAALAWHSHHPLPQGALEALQMLATVDALLPLSLLQAVRNVDTPADGLEAEYVDELRNKRLGLSETIYSQIRRYSEAVRRRQRTAQDEAVALARLIGRRPDAEAVFRAAGRILAKEAYLTVSTFSRQLLRAMPTLVARPVALRRAKKISSRYLGRQFHVASAAHSFSTYRDRSRLVRRRERGVRVLRVESARAAASSHRQHRRRESTCAARRAVRGLRVARRLARVRSLAGRRRGRRTACSGRPRACHPVARERPLGEIPSAHRLRER